MKVEKHHTPDELQDLLRRERRASIANRIRIVRQAALGGTAPQIALECGLSRRSVQEWVGRDNAEGLPGLEDRPGRGRPEILDAEQLALLAQRIEDGPQADDPCSLRGIDFRNFIESRFGKRLALSTVYNLLHELGYAPLVPRPRHRGHDPAAAAEFKKKSPRTSPASRPPIPENG